MNDDFPSYLIIYDSVGKKVSKIKMVASVNRSEAHWNTKGKAAGQYIVVVYSMDGKARSKTSLIISE